MRMDHDIEVVTAMNALLVSLRPVLMLLAAALLLTAGPGCAPPEAAATAQAAAAGRDSDSASPITLANAALRDAAPQPAPRAVVEEPRHHFGIMDPLQVGRHTFLIRNEGDAPLKLAAHATTCKCTLMEVENTTVPPGGVGRVHMEWNTGDKQTPLYGQGGEVKTNDPQNEILSLRVQGAIRLRLGADPPQLLFPNITPTKPAHQETVVYSRVWRNFQVENVTSSIPGLSWKIEPAEPATLEEYEALSGFRLRVTLPEDLPQGEVKGWVRFDVVSNDTGADEPVSKSYELPLEGKVLRRVAVYGAAIDNFGVVHLGALPAGQGSSTLLRLKVRDPDPVLKVSQIAVVPDFVRATLKPHADAAQHPDRYELHVEIPRDAPPCVHLNPRFGEVRLQFEHPRVRELRLRLDFAVLGTQSTAAR